MKAIIRDLTGAEDYYVELTEDMIKILNWMAMHDLICDEISLIILDEDKFEEIK